MPGLPGIAGDGSLLYPGAGSDVHTGQPDPSGPVSSLRLEGLREASKDHALLSLAASMGKAALADEVAASVVRSMQDYAQLSSEYQAARRRLAEIIAPMKTTKPPARADPGVMHQAPERASMQGIRDWGRRNPDELPALLNENPSYVFFREVPPPPRREASRRRTTARSALWALRCCASAR